MNVSGLSTLLKPGLMTVFLPNLPINLSSKTCGECMPITNVLGWPPWAMFCTSGDCSPPSTKLPKQFREHAKLAKKDKITRVAGELAEASARGDQRGLWQGAKKLAPWKPRAKMSIRGPEGTILSLEEQLQALLDHSTRKFCPWGPVYLGAQNERGLYCH